MSERNRKEHIRPTRQKPSENTISVGNFDYTIFITVILLTLIGIVMVFSSSYYMATIRFNNMYHFVSRQAAAALLGFIAMIFMAYFKYDRLKRFSLPLYIVSMVLLVFVSFFGEEVGGARRWIAVPVIGQFQPSEVAKLAIILMVASFVSKHKNMLKKWGGTITLGLLVAACCLVIFFGTNNASSAIIIGVIGFGMIFIASPYTAVFGVAGAIGIGAGWFLLSGDDGFRGGRVAAWRDPFAFRQGLGFQTIQSLYAIASGGMFGLGLGQSRQKLGFIPEAHNDIIFSIIAEELGLVGAGLVLFLFAVLVWRAIKVAINAPDLFGSLIAAGIALMIGSQVVINVAVVTNTIPNTGVPLPFISYGGTSLTILTFCMGILLNISRYSKKA
ncbi:MAG: putative lipid II flippase FtsW [Defluviitaleaceae bacterium]|nr:putative lipid II flippase FtsW [Defluviitaleaceae bacterium]